MTRVSPLQDASRTQQDSRLGMDASELWPAVQDLPTPLSVRIPLPAMSLGAVQALEAGVVLSSRCSASHEVPLYVGREMLSWCEFTVVDGIMAARLTRLG